MSSPKQKTTFTKEELDLLENMWKQETAKEIFKEIKKEGSIIEDDEDGEKVKYWNFTEDDLVKVEKKFLKEVKQ